jgi:hypothetical protein
MQALLQLGFNLQLLGSQHYVESKLENLTQEQMKELKTAFLSNKHPRFKKEVAGGRHSLYGKTSDYIAYVKTADNFKIGRLIKILAMLSQTKVYLFWRNDNLLVSKNSALLHYRYFKYNLIAYQHSFQLNLTWREVCCRCLRYPSDVAQLSLKWY